MAVRKTWGRPKDFAFYFEAGKTYEVTLEVSIGEMAYIISAVQDVLSEINDCYLEILKLTGANPDKNRDYDFSRIMPATVRNLLVQYRALTNVVEYLKDLTGTTGSSTATLIKVANLLYRMGSDEDKIAENLENLKTNIGTLGTWVNDTMAQPVTFDYFTVQSADNKILPKAKAGFFESIGFHVHHLS